MKTISREFFCLPPQRRCRRPNRVWLVILLVVTLGWSQPLLAQDQAERENLTDIREVNVVVEAFADDAEAAGLRSRVVESAIEERLEMRNVPLGNSRNAADLYVSIDTFQGSTGLYAYCVEVAVQQLVTIQGNQLRTLADVWEVGSLGTVGAANLPQVEQVVLQIVDMFIEDYLEMNGQR